MRLLTIGFSTIKKIHSLVDIVSVIKTGRSELSDILRSKSVYLVLEKGVRMELAMISFLACNSDCES
jgi:hypothetical protein